MKGSNQSAIVGAVLSASPLAVAGILSTTPVAAQKPKCGSLFGFSGEYAA